MIWWKINNLKSNSMHEWGSDRHNNRFVACRQTCREGSDFRIAAFFQNLIFFFVLNPLFFLWNAKMPKRSIIQESVGNKIWERDCWRLNAFFTKLYFVCCYFHTNSFRFFQLKGFGILASHWKLLLPFIWWLVQE